ncbi:ExeM/NucH family extracellular endonuclease [Klenkia sp. PcliD-1-E]|uniref:ExeM/NucH family extracellular endonuclease n=1 Tax=Klenkia sp. PcliD-1-E TaxID=2954492 RepID=UPI002097B100|nr:ExeM/NucH family extracellular endonuclease [Klenkia sp. PcliD-1-E]MCO7221251.1 ExeM/NucH family extracellular endonuclease [Klenkia sp. PcliD-1-E]
MSPTRTARPAVLGVAVGALVAGGLVTTADPAAAAPTDARITEIHYDNAGADTGEAIEVTAPSPADLTGLSLVLYNGSNGASYGTLAVPASSTGIAVVPAPGLQNGAPDGVALVANGTVVEFLSYEGVLTATNGPANGLTSTDIGVAEDGAPEGQSLQLVDGTWTGPLASTFGSPNTGGGTDPDPEPEPTGPACDATAVPIGSVQGSGAVTPVAGQQVTIRGTVVADLQDGGFQGFHVQDAGDGDPATSDAVFVYAPGGRQVDLGDEVVVTGTAAEFPADDPLSVTQLTQATYRDCGTAALPEPVALPMPSDDATREAFEGMLVTPAAELTVTELFDLTSFGEVLLSSGGRLLSPTQAADPGAPAAAVAAENVLRSITLDDGRSSRLASGSVPPYLAPGDPVRIGDTADLGPVVLSAGFGSWRLQPATGDTSGTTFTPTNPRTDAPAPVGGDLRVADYNVLNYFVTFGGDSRGAADEAELADQQAKIVAGLQALDADVITLHEIENSAITTPDTPYRAVETLLTALSAADGHSWAYAPAHEDTDVITNAIVYRTDVLTPVGEPVAYTSPAFANARSPIAQTFRTGAGEVFSVVANHLKSKGSECATGNDDTVGGAGNCNGDRTQQATELVAFAQQVASTSGDPDVLLTGDFNSYRFEDPLDVVRDAGYTELGEAFAPDEYSYVFDGGSGSLDHAFATPSLAAQATGLTVWETNAVESFAYQYDSGVDPLYAPDPYRASDHNPTVIGFALDTPATAAVDEDRPFRGDRVTVTGTGFAPGEQVTVTIGGRSAGSGTADAQGSVVLQPRVPVLLGAGEQQVVLTGASGETAGTSITLRSLLQELIDRLLALIG